MRLVDRIAPGHLGVNYMWLPTWIGMNQGLIREIEAHLSPLVVGKALTEETLDEVNQAALSYLVSRFPQAGLYDYLDGLKFVDAHGSSKTTEAIEEGRQDASQAGQAAG